MSEDTFLESIRTQIVDLLDTDEKTGGSGNDSVRAGKCLADKNSFSRLLRELVHSCFDEEEAQAHWKKILSNYDSLKDCLKRDVGIRVAAYDYFLNDSELFKHGLLVDHHFIKKLRHGSLTDPLTGAFNRTYFELHIKKELGRAIRHNRIFSLLLLDFSGLGTLAERIGQERCDEFLIRLAKLLKSACREEDMLCRFGSEEFIFLMPETEGEGAFLFAERILYKIKDDSSFAENGISASCGIAEYPQDSRNIFSLIKCADSALYHAKAKGKDKISFYRERNELNSIYDSLTGLFNCSHFEALLAREHARAVRHGLTYSILFLDIDKFNKVNDDEGNVFGDLALTQFSCLLSSRSRELDVLARLSGGQFILLLPETDGDAAGAFAERLVADIIGNCGTSRFRFTFSCGIASYPFDGFESGEIARLAREACDGAKKEGGGRVARCTHNRRSVKRYPRKVVLGYKQVESVFTDAKKHSLVTEDISLHGMRCTANEEIPLKSSLVLELGKRHGSEGNLVILARVVWTKQSGKSDYLYGIEFLDANDEKTAKLKEIIKVGETGKAGKDK